MSTNPNPNPSIPTSPLPGKDPPQPQPQPLQAQAQPFRPASVRKLSGKQGIHNQPTIKRQTTDGEDILHTPTPPPLNTNTNINTSPSTNQNQNQNQAYPSASSQTQTQSHPYPTSTSTSTHPLPSALSSTMATTEPKRPFNPLFTLISDPSHEGIIHPSKIHYIFSDDDGSIELSNTLAKSLGGAGTDTTTNPPLTQDGYPSPEKKVGGLWDRGLNTAGTAGGGREERVVIVDLNANGDEVVGVSSLSEKWQVLGAGVEGAPIWEGEGRGDGGAGGLMLRIEGVGVEGFGAGDKARGGRESAIMGDDELLGLLDGFDKKMAVLRRVVGGGNIAEGKNQNQNQTQGEN